MARAKFDKYGILPPPPIKRGTVVQLRDSNGRLMNKRGIVLSNTKPSAYTRAYGREVHVCIFFGKKPTTRTASISEKSTTILSPVGKVKKIPKACRDAMKEYKR